MRETRTSGSVGGPAGQPPGLPDSARAGQGRSGRYCFGDEAEGLPAYGWFDENSKGRAHPVGGRKSNGWGLFDLHGNVWEWCEDTYHEGYEGAPTDGSAWTEGGDEWEPGSPLRVGRGGRWYDRAVYCRSANRFWWLPADRGGNLGFRPSFSPLDD